MSDVQNPSQGVEAGSLLPVAQLAGQRSIEPPLLHKIHTYIIL
jgi:hypothetical protein